jgi:hypothetical protein
MGMDRKIIIALIILLIIGVVSFCCGKTAGKSRPIFVPLGMVERHG